MITRYLLLLLVYFHATGGNAQVVLKDAFGRNLFGQTITLVDWEGQMANPAIRLTLESASFQSAVVLTANGSRLYFNTPSVASSAGPSKSISFRNSLTQEFYLSIFPDRGAGDEDYSLTIEGTEKQTFPVHVIDQDKNIPVIDYNIIIDYSQDKPAYNFFSVNAHRKALKQAADDWAYFLPNMNFDTVKAGAEQTFIWNDLYAGGSWVRNATAYNGFLWYPYGFHTANHANSGEASTYSFQTINKIQTRLRPSGGYQAEAHGNYNTLGYDSTITDDSWYLATNFGDVKADLYSVAIHELGHAMCFNPAYPVFQNYKAKGYIDDPAIVAYQGEVVPVDASDHLSNGQSNDVLKVVDRISKKGVFGSEFAAFVPYGRWLITKLNLLILKTIGYDLKPTSAFKETAVINASLPNGISGQSYSAGIIADGGIPFYKFEVLSGALPPGLDLNSFNGQISGLSTQTGSYSFTIRVNDYDKKYADRLFTINILSVLPVNLSGMSASNSNCNSIMLSWKTSLEQNNKGFDVERSTDGKNFNRIGFVASEPNHNLAGTYKFTDNSPVQGVLYYRLKQLDLDDRFSYSPAITTRNTCSQNSLAVYPNPVSNVLHITGLPGGANSIRLVDVSGKTVASWFNTAKKDFNISHISAGIYFVLVNETGKLKIVKE